MAESADWLAPLSAFEQAMAASGEPHHTGLRHGTMRVLLYRPVGDDTQTPHRQDEIYIVRQGRAQFRRDGEARFVSAGDCLFVPAAMPHRFEDFSADFDCWVVFWGPEGGEN